MVMKGFREVKKPTTKAVESRQNQMEKNLEKNFGNLVMAMQASNNALRQEIMTLQRRLDTVDYRSLSTLRLAGTKGLFTAEEHEAQADVLRIEQFDELSAADDKAKGLILTDAPVSAGLVAEVRLIATHPADAAENAGQRISELSLLRSKILIGSGELAKEVEDGFIGLKAGEVKTYSVLGGEKFGPYEGKTVSFKVEVLRVLSVPVQNAEAITAEEALTDAITGDQTVT